MSHGKRMTFFLSYGKRITGFNVIRYACDMFVMSYGMRMTRVITVSVCV